MNSSRPHRFVVRRFLATVAATVTGVAVLLAGSVVLAGPASAGVPEGWATEDDWSLGGLLIIVIAVPVVIGLVLALLTLLPGVMRGERLIPKAATDADAAALPGGEHAAATKSIESH